MTTTMQKWEITAPGDANLRLVTAATPLPKPGEILLEGRCCTNRAAGEVVP